MKQLFFPFKVGQRIEVLRTSGRYYNTGDIGKIISVNTSNTVFVCDFDQPENKKVYSEGHWSISFNNVKRVK